MFPRLAALACTLVIAAPAAAQDAAADYQAIFESQLEAFRDLRTSPELGRTRGLVLAPVEAPEGAAVAVEPAEPGLVLAPPAGDEATPVPAALEHFVLPRELQANMLVTFAFDSAAIAEGEKPKLRQICGAIREADIGLFRIVGHTDATGDALYNQRLSVRRAEEVKRFFVDDCGIEPDRLEAIGVGKQFPFNEADPFAGENRRVEFQAIS